MAFGACESGAYAERHVLRVFRFLVNQDGWPAVLLDDGHEPVALYAELVEAPGLS